MERLLLTFILFILPFIVLPWGISAFETPKIFLAELTIEVLAFVTVFWHRPKLSKYNKAALVLLTSILLLSLLHLLIYPNSQTFFGNSFRLQGVALLWHLIIFSLISANISIEPMIPVIPLMSLITLIISAILWGPNDAGRAVGTLGEPNALAATAIFLWPFMLSAKNKKTLMIFAGVGLTSIILLLSGSRSALVALVIQLVFLGLIYIAKVKTKFAIGAGLILLITSLFLPQLDSNKLYENRAEIWQTAFKAGLNEPIVGNGFGNLDLSLTHAALQLTNALRFEVVDSSHNIFLDWWVQGGIVGLGSLIALVFFTLINFSKRGKELELVQIFGLLTVLSFNPASIATLVAFWWILGKSFVNPNKI